MKRRARALAAARRMAKKIRDNAWGRVPRWQLGLHAGTPRRDQRVLSHAIHLLQRAGVLSPAENRPSRGCPCGMCRSKVYAARPSKADDFLNETA